MIPNTLEGELFRRKLRNDYSEYVKYVNEGFYMTKFHKYLCSEIQTFLEMPPTGKAMDILLLSVPPQHGKSFTLTETLPSWFLGKHPTDGVILCSYDSDLAEKFSRKNRDKYTTFACDVFRTGINKAAQGVALWETDKGGTCRAAGLKAGITSYGCELFIIDDPIKNKEQAQSEVVIKKIHDEMGPSVQSRIHPGGKLIVIQTRWVDNDCIGYILKNWKEFIWKYINLPCECEDEVNDPLGRKKGEALMGEHLGDYGIPQKICNDNNWLKSKKILVTTGDGEYTWNALYQGHPSAESGNLFKEEWWQRYDRGIVRFEDFEYTLLSVDASFKKTETSDMVGITLWGLAQNHVYLYKLINKRMGFVETVEKIKAICKEYPTIDNLLVEDKANGSAIIDVLNYTDNMPSTVPVNPLGGKYSRAQAVSPFVKSFAVHIPISLTAKEELDIEWDEVTDKTGVEKFIEQHSKFPFMAHDDMVDSTTQALARLIKLITGEEPMPEKNYIRFVRWYPDMWEDYEQMNALEQEQFIRTYGAPLEWAPEDYVDPIKSLRKNY